MDTFKIMTSNEPYIIKDSMISFCLSLLYPLGLSLIPGILRIQALKTKRKDKSILYSISKIIAFI